MKRLKDAEKIKKGAVIIGAVAVPLCVTAAVFFLTAEFLAPQDTLARFAPANAAVYVHANLPAADSFASALPDIGDARPDELAVFAMKGEGGELEWGALLGWKKRHRLTEKELAWLKDRSIKIDKQTYFMGGEKLAGRAKVASVLRQSIIENTDLRQALAASRGAAPLQGFVAPSLSGLAAPEPFNSFFRDVTPAVFGFSRQKNRITAIVVPPTRPGLMTGILGFSHPSAAKTGRFAVDIERSSVSFYGSAADINPLPILLGKTESARVKRGMPDNAESEKARQALFSIFSQGNISMAISSDSGEDVKFIAHFSKIQPEEAMRAISDYLDLALPAEKRLKLPDRSEAVEYIAERGHFQFKMAVIADKKPIWSLENDDFGVILAIASDGRDGILAASNQDVFEYNNVDKKKQWNICNNTNLRGRLAIQESVIQKSPQELHEFLAKININSLIIEKTVDNSLLICGYH